MTFKPVRCRDCADPSVWTVKARVPARATSRLGHKSFQANCCDKCLPQLVSTALTVIDYTAPVKVELWMPASAIAWADDPIANSTSPARVGLDETGDKT